MYIYIYIHRYVYIAAQTQSCLHECLHLRSQPHTVQGDAGIDGGSFRSGYLSRMKLTLIEFRRGTYS